MNSTAPRSTPRVGWAATIARAPRVSSRATPAPDEDLAVLRPSEPREALEQLVLAVPLDTGQPHDLALAHLERQVAHRDEPTVVAHREVASLERGRPRCPLGAGVQRRDR